jgi:hypothetical protein
LEPCWISIVLALKIQTARWWKPGLVNLSANRRICSYGGPSAQLRCNARKLAPHGHGFASEGPVVGRSDEGACRGPQTSCSAANTVVDDLHQLERGAGFDRVTDIAIRFQKNSGFRFWPLADLYRLKRKVRNDPKLPSTWLIISTFRSLPAMFFAFHLATTRRANSTKLQRTV